MGTPSCQYRGPNPHGPSTRWTALLFAAACILLLTGALPAQTLRFGSYPATVSGTYNPDAGATLAQTITIRHRGIAGVYFVTFSAGQSGNFAARAARSGVSALPYQLYDSMTSRNVLKDLTANPPVTNVLAGSFAASGTNWTTQNLSCTVHLPSGQLPPAGTYTDAITMEVYVGTPSSHGARQQRVTFTISITMSPSLDVALVATGAPFNAASTAFTFDFGILSTGGSRGADLVVRANSLSTISITSLNGGVMKNSDSGDDSAVPYELLVNGSAITLPAGTPRPIASSAPATSFSGTRYGISTVIGSWGWATEGSYSDVLTVQAAAN
jgi:spore coat protein U-like protein